MLLVRSNQLFEARDAKSDEDEDNASFILLLLYLCFSLLIGPVRTSFSLHLPLPRYRGTTSLRSQPPRHHSRSSSLPVCLPACLFVSQGAPCISSNAISTLHYTM